MFSFFNHKRRLYTINYLCYMNLKHHRFKLQRRINSKGILPSIFISDKPNKLIKWKYFYLFFFLSRFCFPSNFRRFLFLCFLTAWWFRGRFLWSVFNIKARVLWIFSRSDLHHSTFGEGLISSLSSSQAIDNYQRVCINQPTENVPKPLANMALRILLKLEEKNTRWKKKQKTRQQCHNNWF